MTGTLFPDPDEPSREALTDGALLLRGWLIDEAPSLLAGVMAIAEDAPFRHLETPGGHRMSVAMTNCGAQGWVSDRHGYRYAAHDPTRTRPWPAMPALFRTIAQLAAADAGYRHFEPDACLINRYAPGARLALHQDRDECALCQPIVSVSLGVPATFLFGGLERSSRPRRLRLNHGDVVVWGGASRLAYHGIDVLKAAQHPLTGDLRYNLTFRVTGHS
jgi:alkylated DNA repair protein (DNA oxidative demethylase)